MPGRPRLPIHFIVGYALFLVVLAAPAFQDAVAASEPTPTPGGPLATPTWVRRVLVPSLAASSTQADYGAEVYRLVCSACHGDRGQGLTAEWISTWNPQDQNCWQSKCHGENHPSDGFYLPRYAPPLIGENSLRRFKSAQDLHDYIASAMPWQAPGELQADENWQLTAFLLRANGIDPIQTPLDERRAAGVLLWPDAPAQPPEAAQPGAARNSWFWWALGGGSALVLLAFAATVFFMHRR